MAIKARPTQTEIEEFINGGGSVAKEAPVGKPSIKQHKLEIDSDLFEEVKQAVKTARMKSRNAWIVQAIVEKLKRDATLKYLV